MSTLTPREHEVVLLAAAGLSDKEIAKSLGVALATVRTHWDRIRERRHAAGRAHAIAIVLSEKHAAELRDTLAQGEVYRVVLESLVDPAIFLLDTDGTIESWNAGVQKLLGYAQDEFVGMHLRVLLACGNAAEVSQEAIDTAIAVGTAEGKGWIRRKDGTTFWATSLLTTIVNKDGDLLALAEVLRAGPPESDELE